MSAERIWDFEQTNAERGAQIAYVESSAKYMVPLCIAALILSVAALFFAYHVNQLAQEAKTQAWLAERRLLDIEAYAILNGWRIPTDQEHGPLGNLERMKETSHARQ